MANFTKYKQYVGRHPEIFLLKYFRWFILFLNYIINKQNVIILIFLKFKDMVGFYIKASIYNRPD